MDKTWLREQIAFAIWNDTNPTHMREHVTLKNIGLDPEITTALGDGWKAIQNLGLDWRLNRKSFLKLADVAISAFEAADADGSAYAEPATAGDIAKAFEQMDELIAAIGNGHSSRIAAELAGIRDTLKRASVSMADPA